MARSLASSIVTVGAAVALSGCARIQDRLAEVPPGATREEVVRIAGPATPPEALPHSARALPEGCADQLVYEDVYRAAAVRAVASRLDSSRTFLHVCFDKSGRKMSGTRFTLITY
jgi:hypothetical protein